MRQYLLCVSVCSVDKKPLSAVGLAGRLAMGRVVLGVFLGLMLGGVGIYWWQSKAQVEIKAPATPVADDRPSADELPLADGNGLEGPMPPEASGLTREQRRERKSTRLNSSH